MYIKIEIIGYEDEHSPLIYKLPYQTSVYSYSFIYFCRKNNMWKEINSIQRKKVSIILFPRKVAQKIFWEKSSVDSYICVYLYLCVYLQVFIFLWFVIFGNVPIYVWQFKIFVRHPYRMYLIWPNVLKAMF